MDIDWTLVNVSKNLVEDQLDKPILRFPIVSDYRQPLAQFVKPGMKILDVGANQRTLKDFLESAAHAEIKYRSMDIDHSFDHDFYSFDEISGEYEAIACFEVIEHMSPKQGLELFTRAHELLVAGGRLFVSTPNVYHPMSFWSDATHITPFRLRHLAGWMATAGFSQFSAYRVCRMDWKKRWRAWRYRGMLRLLNLDFAPGIVVVGQK